MGLSDMMDLLERHGFQRVFKNKLLENGEIVEGFNSEYDINYAVDSEKLFLFLENTQKKEYDKVSNKPGFKVKFIKRLRQ